MINILNNKLKFKERYLSLQKNSNVNPKNFKNILNNRINNLYSFSNNLNKFSISSPSLVFKSLPFLIKGLSIKETEAILKLSPLSRKGLDHLNITPKTKSTFLYPNTKLSNNLSQTCLTTSNLSSTTSDDLSLNKGIEGSVRSLRASTTLNSFADKPSASSLLQNLAPRTLPLGPGCSSPLNLRVAEAGTPQAPNVSTPLSKTTLRNTDKKLASLNNLTPQLARTRPYSTLAFLSSAQLVSPNTKISHFSSEISLILPSSLKPQTSLPTVGGSTVSRAPSVRGLVVAPLSLATRTLRLRSRSSTNTRWQMVIETPFSNSLSRYAHTSAPQYMPVGTLPPAQAISERDDSILRHAANGRDAEQDKVRGLELKNTYQLPLTLPIKEGSIANSHVAITGDRTNRLTPTGGKGTMPVPSAVLQQNSIRAEARSERSKRYTAPHLSEYGTGARETLKVVYKPFSLATYLELLNISHSELSTCLGLIPCPSPTLATRTSPFGARTATQEGGRRVKDSQALTESLNNKSEEGRNKDIEQVKKERAIRKWKAACKKKNKQLMKLGAYTPLVSDKNWFTFLEKLRQNIKSRYTFNSLLSRSQSVSYYFNKDYKKINFNSIYKILKSFFTSLSALISNPVFQFSPDKVNIRLFYFKIPTVSTLKKERKARKFVRNTGILEDEIKNRFKLRKIMQKLRMKLFIAKWKESNNLVRLPRIPETFSKFMENAYQPYLARSTENQFVKAYISSPAKATVTQLAAAGTSASGASVTQSVDLTLPLTTTLSHSVHLGHPLSSEASSGPHLSNMPLATLTPPSGGRGASVLGFAAKGMDAEQENMYLAEQQGRSLTPNDQGSQLIKTRQTGNLPANAVLQTGEARDGFKSLHAFKTHKLFNTTMVSLNIDKLKYLVFILEKAFNKTVILDLVRLKYPYHDSNILAQVLGLNSNRKNFRQMVRKLLYTATIKNPTKMIRKQNFTIIPSYLSGIKIRLAGRLMTQRVVPRFTVQSIQMGSLARGKINYVDSSRLTLKNKRGAFSFTVSTSHIFESER